MEPQKRQFPYKPAFFVLLGASVCYSLLSYVHYRDRLSWATGHAYRAGSIEWVGREDLAQRQAAAKELSEIKKQVEKLNTSYEQDAKARRANEKETVDALRSISRSIDFAHR